MEEKIVNFAESENKLLTRKNIITFLLVGIMLLVIPVGVQLIQQQQTLKSKAASEASINFSGEGVECDEAGNCTTTSDTIQIELNSPFGPPAP